MYVVVFAVERVVAAAVDVNTHDPELPPLLETQGPPAGPPDLHCSGSSERSMPVPQYQDIELTGGSFETPLNTLQNIRISK